jgi:hypothetical protein
MADVLVDLVGLAEQCRVDVGPTALSKIEKSTLKHPVDPTRSRAPAGHRIDPTQSEEFGEYVFDVGGR